MAHTSIYALLYSTGKAASRNRVVQELFATQDDKDQETEISREIVNKIRNCFFDECQVLDGTPRNTAPKPSRKNRPEWSQSQHLLLRRAPSLQKVSSAPPTPLRRSARSILQSSSTNRSHRQEKRVSDDLRPVDEGFHVRSMQIRCTSPKHATPHDPKTSLMEGFMFVGDGQCEYTGERDVRMGRDSFEQTTRMKHTLDKRKPSILNTYNQVEVSDWPQFGV
ncbi:hypothetical protein PILCRDRAFT_3761 [Piloderma croceum F 1598]|uniref:Uncharacterized protein n=1 Tax=Piloderma croceum (strain F 1598) TaxID=765440 RepID=A0A0C3BNL8_PILCF|nr:hypothetical protein PILCRDRAFT_3761 [Piloderma croceum F 1598]